MHKQKKRSEEKKIPRQPKKKTDEWIRLNDHVAISPCKKTKIIKKPFDIIDLYQKLFWPNRQSIIDYRNRSMAFGHGTAIFMFNAFFFSVYKTLHIRNVNETTNDGMMHTWNVFFFVRIKRNKKLTHHQGLNHNKQKKNTQKLLEAIEIIRV